MSKFYCWYDNGTGWYEGPYLEDHQDYDAAYQANDIGYGAFVSLTKENPNDKKIPVDNIIITRHQPLIDWLALRGIVGTVIAQATIDDVRGKHVYGVLPLWLASEAEAVTEVSMPNITLEQRRQFGNGDLPVEAMDAAGAHLVTYQVKRVTNA